MQRSRLKNIINKSKELSKKQEIRDPFEEFKKSLPIEVDDNYRLRAAWEAYDSPRNYNEALWFGLIQPVGENNFKFPSIGYNKETDEYEYLNKGEDNEIVAKDIRVWDNDVIPLVKELKYGGYIRKFNKEKNCWTYTKNLQKEDALDQEQINIQKEQSGTDSIKEDSVEAFKQGGQMNVIPEGALHARKNNMEGAGEDFTAKGIPVVDNQGEQQAEIEKNEVIFTKELTDFIENNLKKFNSDETSNSEKDEIAIKVGKRLVKELLTNTDDRTGLISEVEQKI